MRFYLILGLIFIQTPSVIAQSRYYVNWNAPGSLQTGLSWTDAFLEIQTALSVAQSGDTIWVATGTYTPTKTTDRTISINLVNGVSLYGGFSGSENSLNDRDILLNKTVLSGDIGVPGIQTDNSYHVVRGKGLSNSTLIDGFFIRDGYSYNDFPALPLDRFGAGMLLEGATDVPNSRPVIQNCYFEHNYAHEGGGLCATWTDFGSPPQGFNPVNPVLRNCTFRRNNASRNGGAFYKNSPNLTDTFIVENCFFYDNKAFTGEGGGIFFNANENSNTVIRGGVFERDTSWANAGGAIAVFASPPDKREHSLVLDGCLFRQNLALEGGAVLFDAFSILDNSATFNCRMQFCRFEGNKARTSTGSAFSINAGNYSQLSIEVEDCEFTSNLANGITAIINFSQYNESALKMNRCAFFNNHNNTGPIYLCMAVNHGGGLFNTIETEITNCLFYNNGGGVAATSQAQNYSSTKVLNCTFFDNNEYIFVKTWDTLFNQPNGYFNDFFIDNCIVWEPGTDLRKMFFNNQPLVSNMYGYSINHSLLSLNDSTSVPGAEEAFQNGLIWGMNPKFQDSLSGDFRLAACSPAVDKGNDMIVIDQNLLTDLDSLPRIRYSAVDIGAYEQQDSCVNVSLVVPSNSFPLTIKPNPSPDGILHFGTPLSQSELGWICIVDMQGRIVFENQIELWPMNSVSLQDLSPGIYLVLVSTEKQEFRGMWIRG